MAFSLAASFLVACNEQPLDPLPATHAEVHFQGGVAPPVDVLWVVDNSGSMEQEQTKLGNNFDSFIQYFTSLNLDFRLAVTTTDTDDPNHSGKFQGTPLIMTPTTPNLSQTFLQSVSVGINGSGQERGLEGARLALTDPNLTGVNAGFLRPDAILAVIIVSDEEDQSPMTTDEYTNFFKGLKNNDLNKINLSVIVGDVPGGCQSVDANADAGARYHAVADALNGVKASICATDFGPVLDQLGSVIAGLATAFPLDYTPVVESIQVKVDGVVVPYDPLNGWYWNSALGGIVFAPPAVPDECSVVEISYIVEDYGGPLQTGNNEAPPAQCSAVQLPGGGALDGGAIDCSLGELRAFDVAAAWLPGLFAIGALIVMFRRTRGI